LSHDLIHTNTPGGDSNPRWRISCAFSGFAC
jgi:hypothetical protein